MEAIFWRNYDEEVIVTIPNRATDWTIAEYLDAYGDVHEYVIYVIGGQLRFAY